MVRLDDLMHRRLILETLKERDDHPTAEQIYFYVRAQADSVSRAAVYRNLRALQAQGEVVRVGQARSGSTILFIRTTTFCAQTAES